MRAIRSSPRRPQTSDASPSLAAARRRRTLVRLGRGAYEIAAGVLELVREFLHALVELFHLREQPSRVTPVSPHCFPYIFFMIIGVGHGVKRYEALLWVIEMS